jgi:uncharacterized protein YqeY
MSLIERVAEELRRALKAKQQTRVDTLRSMRAAFLTEMKKDGAKTLSDEVCVGLLRRLEKQRGESIAAFESAGRTDRAGAERAELAVLQEFLPQRADEAQTRKWVQAAIAETGASTPKDVGRVMGAVMAAHRDEADGNLARRIAAELLAGG